MTQTICGCPPENGCMVDEAQEVIPCDDHTVPAGNVCGSECALFTAPANEQLATACVQTQVYRCGFCPAEALKMGTLFPELVSPYTRGC